MIKAKIVAHSSDNKGNEIITYLLTYPRIIHAELLTHRLFSRNAASSRAIPFKKMVESVKKEPYIPMAFQRDHKGMQGTEYLTGFRLKLAIFLWLTARNFAVWTATLLNKIQVTKQLANRLLEPFQWYTSLVTATEFDNFFSLRSPKYQVFSHYGPIYFKSQTDVRKVFKSGREVFKELSILGWLKTNEGMAEIHLMALAEAMWDAKNNSFANPLLPGEWHIPFEKEIEDLFGLTQRKLEDRITMVKISSVMAARTSYTVANHELSEWTAEKYCKKSDELSSADPLHASPFEHPARRMSDAEYNEFAYTYINQKTKKTEINFGICRNYKGFIQYRAVLEG